jgi:8-oxo-dGTP pyrophosphatase MutT (NUDIX family)
LTTEVKVYPASQSKICGEPSVFTQDILDEGEPEEEFNPGIAAKLPRKNVASGALIRDHRDDILFVVPTYKPFLEIPGGLTEDDESPLAACRREVQEELGIEIEVSRLLLIDWMPTQGVWRDSVQLVYDGGVLTPAQVDEIRLAHEEIGDIEFLSLEAGKERLRPSMARRVELAYHALKTNIPVYAEFGRTI